MLKRIIGFIYSKYEKKKRISDVKSLIDNAYNDTESINGWNLNNLKPLSDLTGYSKDSLWFILKCQDQLNVVKGVSK